VSPKVATPASVPVFGLYMGYFRGHVVTVRSNAEEGYTILRATGPRPARTPAELESIASLVDTVFDSPETTAAHRAMVDMPGFDPASLPAIWDEHDTAIATVQAVPCEVSLMDTWLPAGIITMVATAEHARGQGFMRECMESAHRWLLAQKRPLGILYGVPEIYPKFGYRPVMPRCETRYELPAEGRNLQYRAATDDDAQLMADLFNAQEQSRPCAVKRGSAPWIWRSQHGHSRLWCIEPDGQLRGYVRTLADDGGNTLTVIEAACSMPSWAFAILECVHAIAREKGLGRISLQLMPDHPLVMEVTRRVTSLEMHGVEQTTIPPQAGMLAVLDAEVVLNLLAPAVEQRLAGRPWQISSRSGLSVSFNGGSEAGLYLDDDADLAHLLTGYPGGSALRAWSRVSDSDETCTDQVFPAAWPRWVLAPFWDE
jgi:predicted N-acetyltransferase YhbS